jgi:outer membrane biosynthesis protein TonB
MSWTQLRTLLDLTVRSPSLALGWGLSAGLHGGLIGVLAWSGQPPALAAEPDDSAAVIAVNLLSGGTPVGEAARLPDFARPPSPRPPATRSGRAARARRPPPSRVALASHAQPPASPPPSADALASTPTTTVLLPPSEARALRIYDDFPDLPASLRSAGVTYNAKVKICISALGTVAEVTVEPGAAPQLAMALVTAIRGWRYRTHLVDGAPTPFCHTMSVDYRVNIR